MTYIFLVAGKGTRLHPLTMSYPKSLFKLDKATTILGHMTDMIRKNDKNARIVVVTGFMDTEMRNNIKDVTFVYNPFYAVTNSIASLWFARDYLDDENVVIINGDVIVEQKLLNEVVCAQVKGACVLIDSSIKTDGDYNVQINGENILVMSKELAEYYGEYAGITKLDNTSSLLLKKKVEDMVREEKYDQWYENALVQMIFSDDFKLRYFDVADYRWTEVDCVDDLFKAKNIYLNDAQKNM